jgi:hypothetical protein
MVTLGLGAGAIYPYKAQAEVYSYPAHVTLLDDTPVYDDYEHPDSPAGVLSAEQSVTVKNVDQGWYTSQRRYGGWPNFRR